MLEGDEPLTTGLQFYRASVGAVITDGRGRLLALERSDVPGAWQLPQGGIDEGEEPLEAVYREIREETGLEPADLDLLGEHPDILTYELPAEHRSTKTGRGQAQKWFLFRLGDADPSHIPLPEDGEFRAWRWMFLRDLAQTVVPFRRRIYQRLAEDFEELS